MEDNSSTSEEYEIIDTVTPSESTSPTFNMDVIPENSKEPPVLSANSHEEEPTLKIANNGNFEDLESQLSEVMKEKSSSPSPTNSDKEKTVKINSKLSESKRIPLYSYSKLNRGLSSSSTGEDNPNYNSKTFTENDCEIQTGDYTIFNQVLYLGAASIKAPRSELEVQKKMSILNSQMQAHNIEVSVSIPSNSDGFVVVYDATTESEMVRFKIHRIIFCAKGQSESPEACCFAFTCSHGETEQTTIFQCHIFRCQIPEAVSRVLSTFVSAFHRLPPDKMEFSKCPLINGQQECHFDIALEIKEDDNKGNFNIVPRDKECFKLRCNVEKQVNFTVTPSPITNNVNGTVSTNELIIERCFGILVAHGRQVKHADMNLLDMIPVAPGNPSSEKYSYSACGVWDPRDPLYYSLNEDTKELKVFMTLALDLVIRGIQEPVRFVIETKVRIFPQNERFWYYSKRNLTHLFSLKIKQVETSPHGDTQFVVVSVDNLGEVERLRPSTLSLSLNLSSLTSSTLSSLSAGRSPSITSIETPNAEDDSDDDEPLLSGSGEVSKECPELELEMWRQVLPKWQVNALQPIPKGIVRLVKNGVPEALRGEVWQLLAKCTNDTKMMEKFRVLITKECLCEQVILRDINRTFPAHDFFKEIGGIGQDALFKISRAYSVFDEEVSYCQGTSFLSAALLLHMPEEQAFCVLVKIMHDYGLRSLFMENFTVLHLRFYQLDRLMEEHVPELWNHFQEQGVESHMFASQWFLTLYTAKFPLFMVFHYIDMFLLLGIDSVFQVAIGLLLMSKKELLSTDFEGILKYFRVSLPKKYRSEETAKQMIRLSMSIKVKRLKKYEREYSTIKQQDLQQDPAVRLEKENQLLLTEKLRLERENDCLVSEFPQARLKVTIEKLEERCHNLTEDLKNLELNLSDTEEEKMRLLLESNQVKDLLKKEVSRNDCENQKNSSIITDYKKICSQLSLRLDKELAAYNKRLNDYKIKVSSCDKCSGLLSPVTCEKSKGEWVEKHGEEKLLEMVKELEMELAKTKLALVEAECKNQDLTHKLHSTLAELQSNKNTWLQKTITSISSLKERSGASTTNAAGPVYSQSLGQITATQSDRLGVLEPQPIINDASHNNSCADVFISQ